MPLSKEKTDPANPPTTCVNERRTMSLLLLQSASWTKPKAKSRNWPMIRNPRAATPCDSVAKFGREDLEMRLRCRRRVSSPLFRLFWV